MANVVYYFCCALIILAAVWAVIRQVDVRLTLTVAALALGGLSGQPMVIVRKFLATFSSEQFVVPICCAVGFAHVLRKTQCDQHLVQLLAKPLRRFGLFLIPGTVLVGFLVNIPVISQVGTAVSIGAVLVPLCRSANLSATTTGAALLLGASLGGDLLNPGAPEWATVSSVAMRPSDPRQVQLLAGTTETRVQKAPEAAAGNEVTAQHIPAGDCVTWVFPLLLIQLAVATCVFWVLNRRFAPQPGKTERGPLGEGALVPPNRKEFRVNLFKAAVPVLPVVLLLLTGPPLKLITVPKDWLVDPAEGEKAGMHFDSRLIGAAMLAGTAVAAVVTWRGALGTARSFFEGAGYGFAHIISVIVAAACFGEAVKLIGVSRLLENLVHGRPLLLLPLAATVSLGFAVLCGSGMATTQSLYPFFVGPSLGALIHPAHTAAVVAVAASAGRTMSPVSAICLMSAAMTETQPIDLMRRVALPLLAGLAAMVSVAVFLTGG
jgi:DcuC family C4-dicarboxylate transporter